MNATAKIRLAEPGDAREMLEIYAPFVENSSVTFETVVPSAGDFGERISRYLEKAPWLVLDAGNELAGYAYASLYRERTAYQWSMECSVYIKEGWQQKGVASVLYDTLFSILTRQGFRNVYAVINLPNERSVAFHERMGFVWFATYEQVGYKLGQWKNVGWWRKILNPFSEAPDPPVMFRDLDKSFLPGLFQEKIRLLK